MSPSTPFHPKQEPKGNGMNEIEQAARAILAKAYDQQFPTYAGLALTGVGDFTMATIRAVERGIQAERERCAKIAEEYAWDLPFYNLDELNEETDNAACMVQEGICAAIRGRQLPAPPAAITEGS